MAHVRAKPGTRRREANVKRLLDTAMGIVTEQGFGALSMNRLADACDYTPGALYRYFASKDMLLSALVERVLEEIRGRFEEGLAVDAEPLVRVVSMVLLYRRFAREQAHKFTMIALSFAEPTLLLSSPEAAEPVVSEMVQTMGPLAEALEAATRSGVLEPGDVIERALIIFASTQGVLQMHKQARIAPDLIDVDRLASRAIRTLLIGWGADPASVDAANDRALALIGRPGDLS